MIRLELPDVLAGYLFIVLGVLFVAWLLSFKKLNTRSRFNATELVRQCPYCGHILLDYRQQELIICPVCKSYFEKGQNVNKV